MSFPLLWSLVSVHWGTNTPRLSYRKSVGSVTGSGERKAVPVQHYVSAEPNKLEIKLLEHDLNELKEVYKLKEIFKKLKLCRWLRNCLRRDGRKEDDEKGGSKRKKFHSLLSVRNKECSTTRRSYSPQARSGLNVWIGKTPITAECSVSSTKRLKKSNLNGTIIFFSKKEIS